VLPFFGLVNKDKNMVQLPDVTLAHCRLAPWLQPTPLERAHELGEAVWLKLESANKTHSFKIRGAMNAMLALDEAARARDIIACSSGNHAQAVAYAAHVLGLKARILMPEHTPQRKVNGVRNWGAEAVLFGKTYDEAEVEARRIESEQNLTFVSPYNDPQVVAGAGTIGLEIIEQLGEVERVLVPVSGGGLISGVALAVKSLKPEIEVIGVCADYAPTMYNVFYGTDYPQVWETIAEALSGDIEKGSITIPLAQQYVDRVVLVTEAKILEAMRWMIDRQGWIVEGGGAVGIAALLSGVVENNAQPTAVVVSGSNVDGEDIRRVLGMGE
jgi:threonine dehydratase